MPHAMDTMAEQREKKLRQMHKLAKTGETEDLVHWCTANFSIIFEKLGVNVDILYTFDPDPWSNLFIHSLRSDHSVTYFIGEVSTYRYIEDLQDSATFAANRAAHSRRPQRGIIGFACSNVGGISIDFWRIFADGNHHRLCPHPLSYENDIEDIEAVVAEVFAQ